jgi:hypothetical protein
MAVLSAGIDHSFGKPKKRTLNRPATTSPFRATSIRNGGRIHLGIVGDITRNSHGGIRTTSRCPEELVDVAAALVRKDSASLTCAVRENYDVLGH